MEAEPKAKTKSGANHDRIVKLSNKLGSLHNNLNDDRSQRFEHIRSKIAGLDERHVTQQDLDKKKIAATQRHIDAFQKDLDEEAAMRAALAEEKGIQIMQLDARLQEAMEAEQESQRNSEEAILSVFAEETAALVSQIDTDSACRIEAEGSLREYLETDIPNLYESLKEEVGKREEMEQRMLDIAMENVTRLQASILEEKKAREDTEEAMLRMMEDVVAKMQSEIEVEKKAREQSELMLLGLLDSTCDKLKVNAMRASAAASAQAVRSEHMT